MEQNIVVNGEYTERDPLNVHNKFIQNSQQYIMIKPLNRSVTIVRGDKLSKKLENAKMVQLKS